MPCAIRGTRGMAGLVVPPLVRSGLADAASVTGGWDIRGPATCPVTGATGVVYLQGGPHVRDAARRSSRNGSGAVSQQHGSLERGGAFLPVLFTAWVWRGEGPRDALFCRFHADLSSEPATISTDGRTVSPTVWTTQTRRKVLPDG